MGRIVRVVDMRSFAESLNRQVQLPADSYELLARGGEWTIIALDCMKRLDAWTETQRQDAGELLAAGEFGSRVSDYARTLIEKVPLAA